MKERSFNVCNLNMAFKMFLKLPVIQENLHRLQVAGLTSHTANMSSLPPLSASWAWGQGNPRLVADRGRVGRESSLLALAILLGLCREAVEILLSLLSERPGKKDAK